MKNVEQDVNKRGSIERKRDMPPSIPTIALSTDDRWSSSSRKRNRLLGELIFWLGDSNNRTKRWKAWLQGVNGWLTSPFAILSWPISRARRCIHLGEKVKGASCVLPFGKKGEECKEKERERVGPLDRPSSFLSSHNGGVPPSYRSFSRSWAAGTGLERATTSIRDSAIEIDLFEGATRL